MGVAYLLAAIAAFVNALTSVLQRIGVETAPQSTALRMSLMAHAIRRREWLGSAVIVAGLGGFFLAAAPSGGKAVPDTHQWVIASVVLIGAITGFIVAALRGPRWWRAASFGAATAVTAAYTAALTKAITTYTTEGWGHVFTHFQPYMLAVTGLGTVFLLQNALHAGPITASRTTLVTLNPLVSIVLGVTLFADRLRSGALWTTVEVVALAVLVAGVHHEGGPSEMLGGARRRALDEEAVVVEGGGPPAVEASSSVGGTPVT